MKDDRIYEEKKLKELLPVDDPGGNPGHRE